MTNWVKLNRTNLETNNYVRKADIRTKYWVDFSNSKIQYYRSLTNENFNIIIFGDEKLETDFYIIPFKFLRHIFVEENLSSSKDKRKRWIANITNHKIIFSKSRIRVNIIDFYSIPMTGKDSTIPLTQIIENDYAIENAKREINVRVKQSLFRNKVLENFDETCCISGIREKDLLVASHIIPWSEKIATRLDPSNGLCLSILYDKLFDRGYFTLDDELKVIVTERIDALSKATKETLNRINGKMITLPKYYPISHSCLEFHRTYIFESLLLS